MTTLAESLVSSSSRPLTVRKRPDLTANRQFYQGTAYWVVKEPVGLQYFRFHEEEYFILKMLDGHVSLQQIKDGFERRFAPQKITFGDLQQFIGMLHRSGLVISNSPGQGKALRERGRKKKKVDNSKKKSSPPIDKNEEKYTDKTCFQFTSHTKTKRQGHLSLSMYSDTSTLACKCI